MVTKTCIYCGERLPISMFPKKANGRVDSQCRICRNKYNRDNYRRRKLGLTDTHVARKTTKPMQQNTDDETEKVHTLRKGVTCAFHCAKYPCFTGINNMSSNLALSCKNFISRSA